MNYDARAIANEFLDLAAAGCEGISPMKLQKLVYYAYGWCLAIAGKPLFTDGIEAWKYGPVVPSVYHEFKQCGNQSIDTHATNISYNPETKKVSITRVQLDSDAADDDELDFVRDLINRVWEVYKKYSAVQLSNATHQAGSPWYQVNQEHKGNLPASCRISDDVIKEYFSAQADKSPLCQHV